MPSKPCHIEVDSRGLITSLGVLIALLVLGHLASLLVGERSWQMERTFNLDREANLPTWMSSALLGLGAVAAYGCGRLSSVSQRRVWHLTALALLLMSCDEVAVLHENLSTAIRHRLVNSPLLSRLGETAWPLVLGPLLLPALLWLGWRLAGALRDSPSARRLISLGAALFFIASVGLELLTSFMGHREWEWLWQTRLVAEEALEMVGSLVLLSGLLLHLHVLQARREA